MATPPPSDSTRTPVATASVPRATSARLAPLRTVLTNGVVVTTKETRKTPAVTISLALSAGTVCDPPDAPGTVHLLSRLIDRGARRHAADELAEALESRGVSLTINVNRHQFSLVCTCLSADFDAVLDVLGEIVLEPTVPESELSVRRGEVLTAIAQDEDSPYVKALHELMALLYGGDHPYGRPAKGTVSSVETITSDRLRALHRERFVPPALSVVIVGDVRPDAAVAAATRAFSGWTAPTPGVVPLASPPRATSRRRRVVPMMNKSQADIAYGLVSITRSDPTYYASLLMNNILGQYALGGRLGDSIRERQGMAYYVSSAFDASVIEGPLLIRAGVSPANVDRAIGSIDEELNRMRADGVTERELTESRQYLIGSMPRALETNAGIASFLQNAEFFGLGLEYDVRLRDYLSAVSRDDIHAAAQRLLDPSRAAVVITGPYDDPARSL
jgi:zinc protease